MAITAKELSDVAAKAYRRIARLCEAGDESALLLAEAELELAEESLRQAIAHLGKYDQGRS